MSSKSDIRKKSLAELEDFMTKIKEPKYRARQVFEWLWNKNCHSFDHMSNLSLELRAILKEHFEIAPAVVFTSSKSSDGTIKNAIKLHDGFHVECVLIPTSNRITACVSSQVGCSLDCSFCATAKMVRKRNLTAAEIVDQVVIIHNQALEHFQKPLKNVVFMGMGEPLLNLNEVVKSIERITHEKSLGLSPKKITVSTSGIPKMIEKLADEGTGVKLALSLHSAIEEKRNKLMPFSEKFPLKDVLDSLRYWYQKTKSKITLEYVVWKGINDTQEDIDALVKFCKHIPCKVNLIEYNPTGDPYFQQAEDQVVKSYVATLEKNRIVAKIRRSRGKDIDAACGQLANKLVQPNV